MSNKAQYDLHEVAVSIIDVFTWHCWAADRQRASAEVGRRDLPVEHVCTVIGWKEDLSLPIAGIEAGSICWTAKRMLVSRFGGAVCWRRIFLSDI